MDLKAFVPAILFKDNEKSGQGKDKDDAKGIFSKSAHSWRVAQSFILTVLLLLSCSDGREGKDAATEELELELEALDITDEPLELEGPDEAENEELAKKLLDEQGKQEPFTVN